MFAESPIVDPDCDAANPKKLTFLDISKAAVSIKNSVKLTPCTRSPKLSAETGSDLYFKNESLQATGSFKERGAKNALDRLEEKFKKNGVITASSGNHGLALSCNGKQLGIPVTVLMPVISPLMKIQKCEEYGAKVIVKGETISVAKEHALKLGKINSLKYINGYDAIDILAGQGTVALEILEQVPDVEAILVPIGGGGLLAGTCVAVKHLKPDVLVYGIEAESCPSFTAAYEVGRVVPAQSKSSIADGLAVTTVGVNSFETAKSLVDRVITVKEDSIVLSILRLEETEKVIVEGGGAVGLAAILEGKVPELKGKKVVSILTGGNIDSPVLSKAIERGLAIDGRLVRLEVVISDRPGGIAELTTKIAQLGASVKDIFHERAWGSTDVFHVRVKVVLETRGKQHAEEIETVLKKIYDNVVLH